MPLIDMTSDLTSIKYGRDRRNGGSSGQPYFTKDIPQRLQSINFANSLLGADFLVRGGVRSVSSVLEDEVRLSKWFSSFNSANGYLFIAKQNLLGKHNSKTGVEQPENIYTPLSTLANAATNNVGIHFLKNGIVPQSQLDDQQKYEYVTRGYNKDWGGFGVNNTNRLLLLYETNIITPTSSPDDIILGSETLDQGINVLGQANATDLLNQGLNSLFGAAKEYTGFRSTLQRYGVSDAPLQLLNYQGGPNTLISGRSIVRKVFDTNEGFKSNKDKKNISPLVGQYLVYSPDLTIKRSQLSSTLFGSTGIKNFERDLRNQIETGVSEERRKELIGEPVDYTKYNRSSTFGESDPGKAKRNRAAYYTTDLSKATKADPNIYQPDLINAQPLYSSINSPKTGDGLDDYIKFHIGILNLDSTGTSKEFTWIHLRAAINTFNDNYSATWNEIKYMGRGNRFYKYDGFTRSVNMGFDVIASSKYEQAFMYDKLNYLASVITPNYSNVGYMRGNIIKLTVGDYLNDVYGILNSITYTIPSESPWDTGRKNDGSLDSTNSLQLPHYIQVSNFSFTPIHSFKENLVPISYVNGSDSSTSVNYISMGAGQHGQHMTQEGRKAANNNTSIETQTV